MHWYGEVKSTFFSFWAKQRLPPPENYFAEYSNTLKGSPYRGYNPDPSLAPLNPDLLNRVYGFGNFFGGICGGLLGMSFEEMIQRVDWCGLFNLGISLFDYICDELNGLKTISSIPAFQLFLNEKSIEEVTVLGPVEKLLNDIAVNVLGKLQVHNNMKSSSCETNLMKSMKKMFDAEILLSTKDINDKSDPVLIKKALYLKSVEPFRVMAEWMSYGTGESKKPLIIKNARKLGRSLGFCYGLFDDARDVWLDLENNRWNSFLLHALEEEPDLFIEPRSSILDFKLTNIWERQNLVQKLSDSAISELVKIMSPLNQRSPKNEKYLGLIGASLARW